MAALAVSGSLLLLMLLMPTTIGPSVRLASAAETPPGAHRQLSSAPVLPTPIHHVITVLLENEPVSNVLSQGSYEASLAQRYAFASHYYAACHPSASNYLALITGKTWQCGSDGVTTYTTSNIADLVEARNLTWGGYFESMPTACDASDAYPYIAHHNPFVYPADIVNNATRCNAHDRDFSAFRADVANGTIPNYVFVAANMTNDGHDTGVAGADAWLKSWLPPLMNSSWYPSSVFFIVYDESSSSDASGFNGTVGGHIYFTAVGPYVKTNYTLLTNVTHYNLLTTTEWLLGTRTVGNNDNWTTFPPMKSLFNFTTSNPLSVQATANVTSGTAPLSVGFQSVVTGGVSPYSYVWSFGDGSNSTVADPSHTFVSPGTYKVRLVVTDNRRNSTSANLTVVATKPTPPPPLRLEATTNAVRGPVPFTPSLAATVTGGKPPYSVSWQFGDGSPTASGLAVAHSFVTPGSYSVRATAQDANGSTATGSVSELAYAPLSVVITLSRSTSDPGSPVAATATASGGTMLGLAYNWSVDGTPIASSAASVTVRPATAGTHELVVQVTDAWGDRARGNATLRVVAASNGTGPSPPAHGGPGPWWSSWLWAALAVAGIALAISVYAYLRPPPPTKRVGYVAPERGTPLARRRGLR